MYRNIIVSSLEHCVQHKGLVLWSYVIMSNHVHLIMSARQNNLSDVLRDMKRFTSASILKEIKYNRKESRRDWMLKHFEYAASQHQRNSQYQFWTHENHAIVLESPKFIRQKCAYIHNNPVKAGWVEHASDWRYSSASNYENKRSLIDVELLHEMYQV